MVKSLAPGGNALHRLGLYSISNEAPLNISFLLSVILAVSDVPPTVNRWLSCDLLDFTRSWIPSPINIPLTWSHPYAHHSSLVSLLVRSGPAANDHF